MLRTNFFLGKDKTFPIWNVCVLNAGQITGQISITSMVNNINEHPTENIPCLRKIENWLSVNTEHCKRTRLIIKLMNSWEYLTVEHWKQRNTQYIDNWLKLKQNILTTESNKNVFQSNAKHPLADSTSYIKNKFKHVRQGGWDLYHNVQV